MFGAYLEVDLFTNLLVVPDDEGSWNILRWLQFIVFGSVSVLLDNVLLFLAVAFFVQLSLSPRTSFAGFPRWLHFLTLDRLVDVAYRSSSVVSCLVE